MTEVTQQQPLAPLYRPRNRLQSIVTCPTSYLVSERGKTHFRFFQMQIQGSPSPQPWGPPSPRVPASNLQAVLTAFNALPPSLLLPCSSDLADPLSSHPALHLLVTEPAVQAKEWSESVNRHLWSQLSDLKRKEEGKNFKIHENSGKCSSLPSLLPPLLLELTSLIPRPHWLLLIRKYPVGETTQRQDGKCWTVPQCSPFGALAQGTFLGWAAPFLSISSQKEPQIGIHLVSGRKEEKEGGRKGSWEGGNKQETLLVAGKDFFI